MFSVFNFFFALLAGLLLNFFYCAFSLRGFFFCFGGFAFQFFFLSKQSKKEKKSLGLFKKEAREKRRQRRSRKKRKFHRVFFHCRRGNCFLFRHALARGRRAWGRNNHRLSLRERALHGAAAALALVQRRKRRRNEERERCCSRRPCRRERRVRRRRESSLRRPRSRRRLFFLCSSCPFES